MDIKHGKKPGHATVRFDNFDERYTFGASSSFSSLESWRWHNYVFRGVISLGLVAPYSSENFPQSIDISLKSLVETAANLAGRKHVPSEVVADANEMVKSIGGYLMDLAGNMTASSVPGNS